MHWCRCAYEDCASLLISKQKVSRYPNLFKSLLLLYSILSPGNGVRSHPSCTINYNIDKWKTASSSGTLDNKAITQDSGEKGNRTERQTLNVKRLLVNTDFMKPGGYTSAFGMNWQPMADVSGVTMRPPPSSWQSRLSMSDQETKFFKLLSWLWWGTRIQRVVLLWAFFFAVIFE